MTNDEVKKLIMDDRLITPHIEDWQLPVIQGKVCLEGKVSGHPKVLDGDNMRTAPLVQLNIELGIGVTDNYSYTLGEPNERFLAFLNHSEIEMKDLDIGGPLIN